MVSLTILVPCALCPAPCSAQSRTILADQLKPLILQQTGGDDVAVVLDPHILIDSATAVENVQIDPQRNSFTAYVKINDKIEKATGSYDLLVPIPVLINPTQRGEKIETGNVDYIRVPEKSLNSRIVHDTDDLTGMEAKRNLRAGRPVRITDIRPPQLVEKGERVILTVNTPLMKLTAEGKALENGGKGEMVKVLNVDSKQIVTGTVIAPNTVEVQ